MVIELQTHREVRRFVAFGIDLYRGDPHFVPPIVAAYTAGLVREILVHRRAVGLLALRDGAVVGRLLYRMAHDAKNDRDVCYFADFECVEDDAVAAALMAAMETAMRARGVLHAEGTYSVHDPDTRRGILVDGFDDDPAFLLSYNKPYYGPMLERLGFSTAADTVAFSGADDETAWRRLDELAVRFDRKHDVVVAPLSFRHLDREAADIRAILEAATNEVNYREAPSLDMILDVARNLRFFLDPRLVLIARDRDGTPLGFVVVLPDYNAILKRTHGRLRPLPFLFGAKRIPRARAMLQYVVPAWQNTGLIFKLYRAIFERFRERGITRLEGGTIMKDNVKSFGAFLKLGCTLTKTMRLYGKDLTP